MLPDQEETLIRTFVVRRKQERYIHLLRTPRRRRDFLQQLYHFGDFEPAYIVPLAPNQETVDALLAELKRRGAGAMCYVISTEQKLDGSELLLERAIEEVYGRTDGTLLGCVPGRLAYYEGEPPKNRFILCRARVGSQGRNCV